MPLLEDLHTWSMSPSSKPGRGMQRGCNIHWPISDKDVFARHPKGGKLHRQPKLMHKRPVALLGLITQNKYGIRSK